MGDCLEKKAREAADELNEFRKKSPEYKLYTVGGWGCDAAASAADSAVVPGAGAVFAGVVRTGEKAVGKAIGKKVMREAEESVIEHADEAAARRLLHEAEERAKKEAKKAAERAEREAAERAAKEAEALARKQVQPTKGSPGSYTPDRALPTDKRGVPIPDSPDQHSQLGRSKPKYGSEPHQQPRACAAGRIQARTAGVTMSRYWILDREDTPQGLPLGRLLARIREVTGGANGVVQLRRSQGYGEQVCQWDSLLDQADEVTVAAEDLARISEGTDKWFYDL